MKKLIFAFVLLFGSMFASCGNRTETNTEAVDSIEVTVDSVSTTDSVDVLDTISVNDAGSPIAPDSI